MGYNPFFIKRTNLLHIGIVAPSPEVAGKTALSCHTLSDHHPDSFVISKAVSRDLLIITTNIETLIGLPS